MKHTRAHKKSVARSYRRHRAESKCAGKRKAACKTMKACKVAKGSKRSFCRKAKNTRTRRNKRQAGGFLAGAAAAAKQALLPFLMYKAQKHQQKRVRTQKRR